MWIPIVAWIAAVVVAVIVLGFASYEIYWKADRLRGDAERLLALGETVRDMRTELTAAQERLARSGVH
jgi:hypothetical protein